MPSGFTAVARAAASFASLAAASLPPSAFDRSANTIAPATAVSWIRSPNIFRSPDNHGRSLIEHPLPQRRRRR